MFKWFKLLNYDSKINTINLIVAIIAILITLFLFFYDNKSDIKNNTFANNTIVEESKIEYKEPTTGVEIIFSKDGQSWDKIIAHGKSEFISEDKSEIIEATTKATLRAKANISKFLNEELTTKETMNEISKIITNKKNNDTDNTTTDKKTTEVLIEEISNSSSAIVKGIIILEQNINKKERYVSVKLGISQKSLKTRDSILKTIKTNL